QRAIGRLRRNHVEMMHRLGEMHRVVEPEPLVVLGHELAIIGISRLRALGAGHDLDGTGEREGFLFGHRANLSWRSARGTLAASMRCGRHPRLAGLACRLNRT